LLWTAVLTLLAATLETGCSGDNADLVNGAQLIANNYDDVRSAICLQYSSNSTFCLTSVLTDIESSSGTDLSLSNIVSMLSGQGIAE
jgi:hypothetical protein